ncbi:hypothetical protein CPC16_002234 [Podila verticillata]|nr:hypothetical protein CPC16_002234 [Podila verticillata]
MAPGRSTYNFDPSSQQPIPAIPDNNHIDREDDLSYKYDISMNPCTKTVIVQSTDTCNEMAESYGITFKDMLAWNEKLRRDCMNLDDDEPICVSVSPGGINPPHEPKVHEDKKVVKKVAKPPKSKLQAASKPIAPAAHGPAKVSRIEGNPEIQIESEEPTPKIASSSSNAKGGSRHPTNAATTVGYATFSVVGAALISLVLVL